MTLFGLPAGFLFLTPEEEALREILAALIEVYEDRFSLPEQPPNEIVKHLMAQRGLKQRDLVPVA